MRAQFEGDAVTILTTLVGCAVKISGRVNQKRCFGRAAVSTPGKSVKDSECPGTARMGGHFKNCAAAAPKDERARLMGPLCGSPVQVAARVQYERLMVWIGSISAAGKVVNYVFRIASVGVGREFVDHSAGKVATQRGAAKDVAGV